jgi:hypothetical protein
MKKTTNIKCREFVEKLLPFTASNIFSEHYYKPGTDKGKPYLYAVYSYGHNFPIYAFISGKWYGNKYKYSNSTSRHQGQARPRADITYVTTEELQKLISTTRK